MHQKRVTVFGGSGFIGRYLVKRLAAEGNIVRVAVRDPEGALFLKPFGSVGQIVPMPANLRHEASVRAAISGVDSVVNLVGILHGSGKQTFRAVNEEGPGLIGRIAAEMQVERVVHVSAIGADPESPSEYGRTKAAGEAALRKEFPDAAIVRPSIVIGAEDEFFNRFAHMTRFSPFLPLIGGGKTRFQPVFVGDVAEAIERILARPETAGRTFELGGPRIYTFRQLMEVMLEEIGKKRLLMPVPFWLASLQAAFLEWLPNPPLTRDQVKLLRRDIVVAEGAETFEALGIAPTNIKVILPTYLERFRPGGQFARRETGGRTST